MANARSGQTTGWVGWVMFSGWVMMFDGIVQFIYGLAALFHQHWFVYTNNAAYLVSIATWGWTLLFTGILMFVSGLLLLRGNMFGRTMGIIVAVLNILADLALFAAAPFWSSLAIIVNALIIYAIWAHARELQQ
jgi:hypothetical protein